MNRNMYTLGLPRNYQFISRLPRDFNILVIKKRNITEEGTWYYCKVESHDLNLLSQVELKEGEIYTIHKRDHMTLELNDKKVHPGERLERESGIDYIG